MQSVLQAVQYTKHGKISKLWLRVRFKSLLPTLEPSINRYIMVSKTGVKGANVEIIWDGDGYLLSYKVSE